jgi:hypothetical protein
VPLGVLWYLFGVDGRRAWRRGIVPAAAFALGAAALVLPWTARNRFLMGDPNLIESVSIFNLWVDNSFVSEERLKVQEARLIALDDPAERRALAMEFVKRGLARQPEFLLPKARANFAHFTRPEGLHYVLLVEEPRAVWRHVVSLVLDDAIPLFAVFLVAGPPHPLRRLFAVWTVYYLLMVVVIFHNDVRYRSALMPMALAGAVAGGALLLRREERRRAATWAGLALGLFVVGWRLAPYVGPGVQAARGLWRLRPARAAIARGDLAAAGSHAASAAAADPAAARPWLMYARWLVRAGRTGEAIEGFRRAGERRPDHWTPVVVMPALLRSRGGCRRRRRP